MVIMTEFVDQTCGPHLLNFIVGIVEHIELYDLPNLVLAEALFLIGFEMEHVKFNGAVR